MKKILVYLLFISNSAIAAPLITPQSVRNGIYNIEVITTSSVTAGAFFGDASHMDGIPVTTPGGSTGQIQYKTGGNAFGGSQLVWDGTRRFDFNGSAGDIFTIQPHGEIGKTELFGNEDVRIYSTGVNPNFLIDSFLNVTISGGSVKLQAGTNGLYYCTGSTAGTFDGNLARGNSNAGACSGGTWVATGIYIP